MVCGGRAVEQWLDEKRPKKVVGRGEHLWLVPVVLSLLSAFSSQVLSRPRVWSLIAQFRAITEAGATEAAQQQQ